MNRAHILVVLLLALLFHGGTGRAAENSLVITGAGVESSEDGPFVAAGYRFLAGETVYFTFQIAGFGVKSENRDEVHKVSLAYEVTPEDQKGVALAPAVTGKISSELNPEDKNWTPKRRAAFPIPSLIGAGEYHLHVSVNDVFGKQETAADFPFQVGGPAVHAAAVLNAENIRFLREENGRETLSIPAYSPGDTVFARFEIAGFKLGADNAYHVSYGVTVLRPNGKVFFEQAAAADLESSSFYPAQFLPGIIELTTSADTPHGQYALIVNIRDHVGQQTYELRRSFSIE